MALWVGYAWEVKEDDNAADEKGDGTKKRKKKRKRENNISAGRMKRPIMQGSPYKEISNG